MKSETGICMYCGQVNQIEVEDGKTLTEEEKNTLATKRCTCEQAMNAQEQEKVMSDAERNISDLFQKDMPEVEENPAESASGGAPRGDQFCHVGHETED